MVDFTRQRRSTVLLRREDGANEYAMALSPPSLCHLRPELTSLRVPAIVTPGTVSRPIVQPSRDRVDRDFQRLLSPTLSAMQQTRGLQSIQMSFAVLKEIALIDDLVGHDSRYCSSRVPLSAGTVYSPGETTCHLATADEFYFIVSNRLFVFRTDVLCIIFLNGELLLMCVLVPKCTAIRRGQKSTTATPRLARPSRLLPSVPPERYTILKTSRWLRDSRPISPRRTTEPSGWAKLPTGISARSRLIIANT